MTLDTRDTYMVLTMGSDIRFLCGLNKKKKVLEKFVRFGNYL